MKKTIETCFVAKKKSYYFGQPKMVDGYCLGYLKERGEGVLSSCEKCSLFYHNNVDSNHD